MLLESVAAIDRVKRRPRTARVRPAGVDDLDVEFDSFVRTVEPRLREALVARYGLDTGREATAEALAYAWANRRKVMAMDRPIGYLFRVGQSKTRWLRRRQGAMIAAVAPEPRVEPELGAALDQLSDRQRVCVVLCVGAEWTRDEVADLLDISRSTVQRHVERGLGRLRDALAPTRTGSETTRGEIDERRR